MNIKILYKIIHILDWFSYKKFSFPMRVRKTASRLALHVAVEIDKIERLENS